MLSHTHGHKPAGDIMRAFCDFVCFASASVSSFVPFESYAALSDVWTGVSGLLCLSRENQEVI